MPYKSAKQRAWMHVHEPEVAARWDKEYGGKVKTKEKKKKKKKEPKKIKEKKKGEKWNAHVWL